MIFDRLKQFLGFESVDERVTRYEEVKKAFSDSDAELDVLAKDFFIEKSLKEQRLSDPDNYIIQDKINEKFDLFVKSHRSEIGKAKKRYDSLRKEKETIEKGILGKAGDEFIKKLADVLKNKKETAYGKIKKAYQTGDISLTSFNTVIKGITKEAKTKYADFLLFNEKGEILMLKRAKWEDENHGAWVIPGGHVDPGEDFETAAKRELTEESGFSVDECENVGSYEDDDTIIQYFQGRVDTSEKMPVLQWEESRDYKWVPIEDIKEEAMIFNMRENVMRILGLVNRHKEVIRKAVLAGIISPEQIIKKSKDIRDSSYKEKIERIEARRTDKQYSKEEANYVDNFVDGNHSEENSCDRCYYYRPKSKDNCLKVVGQISHNGHCKFFEHSDTDKNIDDELLKGLYSELEVELNKLVSKRNSVIEKSIGGDFLRQELDEQIEKAVKDISKLQKIKKLIYREGKLVFGTYYVKAGQTVESDKEAEAGIIAQDISQGDLITVGMKNKNFLMTGVVAGFSFAEKDKNYYANIYDADTDKCTWVNLSKADYFMTPGTVGTSSAAKPPEEEYKVIKQLGGSTGAVLVEDIFGNKYVKKTGADKDHLNAEYQALLLYDVFGVKVPHIHKYDPIKGELYTEYIDGADTLNKWTSNSSDWVNENTRKVLQKDFGVDILLANWDVVGLDKDNILVTDNWGIEATRVDVGGSLNKKATGGDKPFGKDVPEIESMLDPEVNPQASQIFKDVAINEVLEQVVDKYDSIKWTIDGMVGVSAVNKNIIAERIEFIRDRIKSSSPKYKLSPINYNGDLFDVGVDADGDRFYDPEIVSFYSKLNKDLQITEADMTALQSNGGNYEEKSAEQYFKGNGLINTPIVIEARKKGITFVELYNVRQYTNSSGSFNDLAKAYSDSITGDINFSIDQIDEGKKIIKEIKNTETVPLFEYYDKVMTAVKSLNHAIDSGKEAKDMNSDKMVIAGNVSATVNEYLSKHSSGEISLTKSQITALHEMKKVTQMFKDSLKNNTKVPMLVKHQEIHDFDITTTKKMEMPSVAVGKNAIKINGFAGKNQFHVAKLKLLCHTIKKLEQIKKKAFYKEGIFSRGIGLSSDTKDRFKQQHRNQNQYVTHQWGSSSSWESKGFAGNGTGNIHLKIVGEGIHIDDISHYSGGSESEILHKPFTMYKTISYVENDPSESGQTVVTLKKIL